MLASRNNPNHDDKKADQLIDKARWLASSESEKQSVKFVKKNIAESRKYEIEAKAAREQYKRMIEDQYASYLASKNSKGKKGGKKK
mmetsp:Transcript_8643/g.19612  ORF Transcript_8643/g.19612 Transcript_8643/m.19612 type:complete len:86 (-) Transcript_8643:759-1016(-)